MKKMSVEKVLKLLKLTASYMILIILSVIFLLPFFWMVSTALKTPSQIYKIPPNWIPNPITFDNIIEGWVYVDFTRYTLNTIFITVFATFGTVLSSALVAYGFARFRSKWNSMLFFLVLSTLMLPTQITLIPSYFLFSKLGWVNTYIPLILPAFLGGGAFNIFLLRQFIMGIPRDLDQAAKIDGCSSLRIFFRIILPVIKPALTSVGIMTVIFYWNDFLGPLIYLSSDKKYTISIGLQFFNSAQGTNPLVHMLMAVALAAIIPIILLFFFAQKYFVQGITLTGVKG